MSEQLALFADDAAAPRGLRYQPDFITVEREHDLIAKIRALPLVSRFRSSYHCAARSFTNFGIEGH